MPNYWNEELDVLSSENVSFAVGTAGVGSRFVAVVIDMVVQLLFMLAFSIALSRLAFSSHSFAWLSSFMNAMLTVFVFINFYAYFFLFEWLWHGLTPGKKAVGLRVLQVNGLPATFWQVLVRNVLRIVDFLPVMYGVGGVAVIFNDHNRRIGDQTAGTIVARERREETASRVLGIREAADAFLLSHQQPIPQTATAGSATESVELRVRLPEQDYEMAQDFLLRRDSLTPAARERLGQTLATRIAQILEEPLPPAHQMESFLEYVVNNYGG